MNRLTLRMKLGIGFGSLLLILAAMGFVANSSVRQLADISDHADQIMTKTYLSSQIEAGLEKQTAGTRAYMLAGREDLLQYDQEGKQQFNDSMDKLSALLSTEEGHRLFGGIHSSYGDYRAIIDHEIELRRADKGKDAVDLEFSSQTAEVRMRVRKAIEAMVKRQNSFKEEIVKEQSTAESRLRYTVVLLGIAGFAVGIGIAVVITRA